MLSYQVCTHYGLLPEPKSNSNVLAYCPFHKDTNPSLSVSDTMFQCWSCHESGNMLNFIIKLEYLLGNVLDEWDAILKIADIEETEEKISLIQIENKRKLTEEEGLIFARQFFDSLKIPHWKKLPHHSFRRRGFPIKLLEKQQIKINSQGMHSIVIPIIQQDVFRGFVSRRENEKIDPKYINNEGLKKEKVVASSLTCKTDILVVEGMTDYFRSLQYGYSDTVCILGSYISDEQVNFIKNYAYSVISGFDNDLAGLKATERLKQAFEGYCPVYQFPLGKFNDICDMPEPYFMGAYANLKKIA